jgi:hypothetical protein
MSFCFVLRVPFPRFFFLFLLRNNLSLLLLHIMSIGSSLDWTLVQCRSWNLHKEKIDKNDKNEKMSATTLYCNIRKQKVSHIGMDM